MPSHDAFEEYGNGIDEGNDSTDQILIPSSTWPDFSAPDTETDGLASLATTTVVQPEVRTVQMPGLGLYRRQSQRNPRSCDVCRARKTACRMEMGPPCVTCRSLHKDCTFTERGRKKRRLYHQAPGQTDENQHDVLSGVYLAEQDAPGNNINVAGLPSGTLSGDEDPAAAVTAAAVRGPFQPPSLDAPPELLAPDWQANRRPPDAPIDADASSHTRSIDVRPSQTYFLLGDTGESDPYLLRRSSGAGPGKDGVDSHISHIQIQTQKNSRQGGGSEAGFDDEKPIVFMLIDDFIHGRYEPRVDEDVLQKAHTDLQQMCSDEVGIRLVKLYFKYVYPYWPVLSRSMMFSSDSSLASNVANFPLSLKAALFATGLPFMVFDDVLAAQLDLQKLSANHLYRICWLAITHEIHRPHLSTLQSCLLLLQRSNDDRYAMDSPFRWSLLAWTISLAQGLGLSTDCSNWLGIPSWEKRLRRRLWWAVFVMDKWGFPGAGLATHIKQEDYDTQPLTANDFTSTAIIQDGSPKEPSSGTDSTTGQQHLDSHFYHLVELSRIVSDILDAFFSIRAANATRHDFPRTIELARPLRSRLQTWKESFNIFISRRQHDPRRNSRLDGNVSLHLAYLVSAMILFRAMLRPLESSAAVTRASQIEERGKEAVRAAAKACCAEVVQFAEQIPRGAWDAFWHSWSRANFAIATSFLLRLLLTSASPNEKEELHQLISRWRWELRSGGGNAGNVLTSLGLLRLDSWLLKSGIRVASDNDDIL